MQTILARIGRFSRITSAMAVLALSAIYAAQLNRASGQAAPSAPPATAPAEARTTPTLFLAGDSTMAAGGGAWGVALVPYFDASRITVQNHAIAGRSSRSYIEDTRGWITVKSKLQKGDFVFIQFGHNDDEGSSLNVLRFRFTLSGVGDEAGIFEVLPTTQTQGGPTYVTGQKVTIHTFGYYIKQMITETQAAGATPIVLSPVPRNAWDNGKIVRGEEPPRAMVGRKWAEAAKVPFININVRRSRKCTIRWAKAKVKTLLFHQRGQHAYQCRRSAEGECRLWRAGAAGSERLPTQCLFLVPGCG